MELNQVLSSVREDDEWIIPHDAHHAFYEHAVIRAQAIAVLHQCIIDNQIERAGAGRSRDTDLQLLYKAGSWIDFYRKTPRKGMEGWRGPAVVLAALGEGMLTVRFQAHSFDVPTNQCRPHILRNPLSSLNSSGPPVRAITAPATRAVAPPKASAAIEDDGQDAMFVIAETDEEFGILVSITSLMPLGSQKLHSVSMFKGILRPNKAAEQDDLALFKLGLEAS